MILVFFFYFAMKLIVVERFDCSPMWYKGVCVWLGLGDGGGFVSYFNKWW